MRPRTTFRLPDLSVVLRGLSAVSQALASKPMEVGELSEAVRHGVI